MSLAAARGKLISVMGDEDTCVGFLLGGIGELNKNRQANFFVVDKNTSIQEIEEKFRELTRREDIAILLIQQNIADLVRSEIENYSKVVPAILEIPSKDHPYEPKKDSILRRAKGLFSAEDFR